MSTTAFIHINDAAHAGFVLDRSPLDPGQTYHVLEISHSDPGSNGQDILHIFLSPDQLEQLRAALTPILYDCMGCSRETLESCPQCSGGLCPACAPGHVCQAKAANLSVFPYTGPA